MKQRPRAIGAYIFAGGFTLGVREHFDVLAHFEDGDYGVSSARAGMPELAIHDDPARWPFERARGIDFLYGNPPCAAWSPIGRVIQADNQAWKSDPRVECARTHFNLLEVTRPTVWAWESVPQAFTRGRPLVDELSRRAIALGYTVYCVLVDAQYVGARQRRKRFFMVASRVAIDWQCPFTTPIHAPNAIAAFPGARNGVNTDIAQWAYPEGMLKEAKPNEGMRSVWERYVAKLRKRAKDPAKIKLPQKAAFAEKRLPDDRAAGTFTGHALLHPTEVRMLSVAECAWLCGYPIDYPLQGTTSAKMALLARGVLPPVGAWLAENVARGVARNEPITDPWRYTVNFFTHPGRITELPLGAPTDASEGDDDEEVV